jgi:hypothetical protein
LLKSGYQFLVGGVDDQLFEFCDIESHGLSCYAGCRFRLRYVNDPDGLVVK